MDKASVQYHYLVVQKIEVAKPQPSLRRKTWLRTKMTTTVQIKAT